MIALSNPALPLDDDDSLSASASVLLELLLLESLLDVDDCASRKVDSDDEELLED
jgi:hypothetical protein